jgi:hypothetical protein
MNEKVRKKIKKGDLVRYPKHISIIYSERWGDSQFRGSLGIKYDIIHAYGEEKGYDNDGLKSTPVIFSRKVMITGSNIQTPTGFGRIKIWN